MRWLFVWLALAGCKHFTETQVASHTDAATAAEVSTHEVKSEGPEHIIMTVEEYDTLCPGAAALPAGESAQAASGAPPRPEEGARLTPGRTAPSQPASPVLPPAAIESKDVKQSEGSKQGDGRDAANVSQHAPTLIRRTVTVTDRGPSLDDLRSWGGWQSKVNTALEVKEEKKSGPVGLLGLLGSLWPVVLIGGAVLAFALLKPAWLGLAWRFVAGAAKAALGKKAP